MLATLTVGCRLAAETAEEATLLLSVGILLVSMVLIAPLIRGNLFLHRVDVLAAALPGGLSAYLAGSGSTHDRLLRLSRLDPLVGPAAWCCELPLSGWGSSSLIVLMIPGISEK